jgi:uncharacterized lipoprotein YajG
MRRILAFMAVVLMLGGCAQLQQLQNIAKFATATVTNPVTKEMEAQIELGFDTALQVLLAYRRACIAGTADKSCRRNIEVIQLYTRQAKPLIAQLRGFVDNNDQVNATVTYNQLVALYSNLKRSATEVGMNVGSLP